MRVLGLLVLTISAACGTIDVGPPTGPPAPCNARTDYFISDVWPKYFERYGCGAADCHDASSGHGYFRLQDVSGVVRPQPTDPKALWPTVWAANLRSIEQNLSCRNPLSSVVLTIPSGRSQPHPPGTTVTNISEADMLFVEWVQ